MEYLGEPITKYETRKTTLTQDGNVESTGWGMIIPNFMVLTHLEQLGENHYKGVFSVYGNGYGQGDDPAEAYEDCCNRLMHGNILPTDYLMGSCGISPANSPPPTKTNRARHTAGVFALILSHRRAPSAASFAGRWGKAAPDSRSSPH